VKPRPARLAPWAIALGSLGLLAWLSAAKPTFVEKIEAITYDWRVKLARGSTAPAATNLGFVDINDRTIDMLQRGVLGPKFGLKWPRHIYGYAVRELQTQGARAVAFDVLFGERREDLSGWRIDGEAVDSDAYFAQRLAAARNVLLAAEHGLPPIPWFATNALTIGDIAAEKDADGVLRRARAFQTYRQWHPAFLQAADEKSINLARAKIEPRRILLTQSDGTEIPPIELDEQGCFAMTIFTTGTLPPGMPPRARPFTEVRVWHMGIVLAAAELKLDLSKSEVDLPAGRITLRGANGDERVIPVDREGYFYIDWSLMPNDPRLTAQNFVSLLQKDRDRAGGQTNDIPELWKDKLVVIGSTATGNDLTDLGATPLAKETFLLSKHWNVANSVIQNRFIRRASPAVEILILLALGALATGLTTGLRPPWSSVGVVVAGAGYVGLAVWAYAQSRLWLPIVLPAVGGLALTHGCVVAYQAFFEQREKRRVKSVFSKIVSPNVVQELLQAETLSLGGARREMTVFFADVRGFTELTDVSQEKVAEYVRQQGLTGDAAEACFAEQARETLATVNLYLATVADQVKQHDGTLDKYIGDCVMAFWGAPTAMPQHALACVRAALEAQRAVAELNERRAAENKRLEEVNAKRAAAGQPPLPLHALLHLGSGINTGVVTVGLMGSDQHILNYTVFGREVNLASRLEGVSGRGRIVISEATYRQLERDDAALAKTCVPLPPVTVKGIRAAVNIYEVPWRTAEAAAQ
jgi:class 3 adenylate cyclase/CHASE2 domain-containing sensor protein